MLLIRIRSSWGKPFLSGTPELELCLGPDSAGGSVRLGGSLWSCQVCGMLRKAFVMSVRAGCEAEYERRHNPIWSELAAVLREHGVRSYSIFLESRTGRLFGYVEMEDEARWEAIAQTPVCRRWWTWMEEIMPAHADGSPVSEPLREVFHLGEDSSIV